MSRHHSFYDTVNQLAGDGVNKGILQLYTEDEALNGNTFMLKNQEVVNFGSCSYLGLEFDERLKATKPRVAFNVDNKLTGEGQLPVEITFQSMDDFSPVAVAKKVAGLDKLLEARTQLANLVTYMDGKAGAEELVSKALSDPALLQSLASAPKDDDTPSE